MKIKRFIWKSDRSPILTAIVVALAYFYFAKLCLDLTSLAQTDIVSVVWAPAGMRFAVVLRLGLWAVPGIALGGLITHIALSRLSMVSTVTAYDAAKIGDIEGIQKEAENAKHLDRKYVCFCDRVLELAAEFEDAEIIKLVEVYMASINN